MPLRNVKPNRNVVFVMLLAASALAIFLPPSWTDTPKHVVQLLVPAQDLMRSAAYRAAAWNNPAAPDVPHDDMIHESCFLSLAAERARVAELQGEVDRLRALREHQLPPSIPLLDAKIVARDIAAWRDSVLVTRGSTHGVSRQDWVASRLFADRGRASAVEDGQAVLARQSLLGRVEQVSPYMCRVQLLSDINSPRIEVRIMTGGADPGVMIDYVCSLRGLGGGRMQIENVEGRYLEQGASKPKAGQSRTIAPGDMVFSAPGQLGLPIPLAIGRISEITENPKERLVYNLIVEPIESIDQLRDVFIVPLVPVESLAIPSGG